MRCQKVVTCLECGHTNPLGQIQCEACGAWLPQTEKAQEMATRQPVKSPTYQWSMQPMAHQSAKRGDAMVHIVIGLVVIAVAAISYFAGCPIIWIGGFLWGAIEIIRGLAMLGGAGGGGLP